MTKNTLAVPSPEVVSPKPPRAVRRSRSWFTVLAVTPAFAVLAFGLFLPFITGAVLSLTPWKGIGVPGTFIGLANYERLLGDASLHHAAWVTLTFAVATVVVTTGLGFLLAFLIHIRLRGWRVYKVVWFIPVIIPGTVSGLLWATGILAPQVGALDVLTLAAGFTPPLNGWLGDQTTVLPTIALVGVWASVGWPMLILLAAMERIPQEVRDAAAIDGAVGWSMLRYITLPSIVVVLGTVVTLQVVWSLKAFDIIYVMTDGGPGTSSTVLTIEIYTMAFKSAAAGRAAALSVMFLLFITVIALLQRRLTARWSQDT